MLIKMIKIERGKYNYLPRDYRIKQTYNMHQLWKQRPSKLNIFQISTTFLLQKTATENQSRHKI